MIKNNIYKKKIFLFTIILFIFQFEYEKSYAVDPEEFLSDNKQELRARNISKNIRCLVCQNQSIDDSTAPLAKDLRVIIRKKIVIGSSDDEIYTFLTKRYGDFILLKPSYNLNNIFLWLLPFVFLIIAIFIIFNHNLKHNKK